jgi:hypothetical protein
MDIIAEKKGSEVTTKRGASSEYRKARSNFTTKMETKKANFILNDSDYLKIKSKEMAS